MCISKGQRGSKAVDQVQPKVEPKQDQQPVVKCKICGKPHPTYKCWNNPDNKKVADKFIRQNRQELVLKQASDAKLADIRRRVESGSVTKGHSFSSGETKFIRRNGLIYRHFKKNANVSLQLVVPSSLTHIVMNLAHESRKVVNHRGRKETISKVLDEFYWPGVCREVTQFCRSCAICQRTTHNIKVAMTQCCSICQRNISSKEALVSRTRRTDSQTERRRSYGSGRRCPIPYYWRNMTGTESSSQC